MKILVTGGAGFIGSNVVDAYVNAGHEVAIIDNLTGYQISDINLDGQISEVDYEICKQNMILGLYDKVSEQ